MDMVRTSYTFACRPDLDYLKAKLKGYPDQRLASNVLEGVRLEADLDLITVLCPQLVSIGIGYESVQKTVRELKERHFYDFFEALPFWPIVLVGQGSQVKKLGVRKYRRTSNFSGPHQLVVDKTGRRAVPINPFPVLVISEMTRVFRASLNLL